MSHSHFATERAACGRVSPDSEYGSLRLTQNADLHHRGNMIEEIPVTERSGRLLRAGLAEDAVQSFLQDLESARTQPAAAAASLPGASARLGEGCARAGALLSSLPAKSRRNAEEKAAGHALVHLLADAVWRFFRAYRKPIYDTLTGRRMRALRVEELAWAGADLLPGI